MWNCFQNICICIGFFYLLSFFIKAVRRFVVWEKNLHSRYSGGWAVVTGGTDGIGLGYCEELAQRKFNICIVSRNKQKLGETAKKLGQSYPGVEIRTVVADLGTGTELEFYENIMEQVKDLDVSILVNNVGTMMDVGLFCTNSPPEIRRELTLNMFPIAILTRCFLPKMLARPSRSAVINLSSSAVYASLKGSAHYCSTKEFDDTLSRALQYEYRHKIDFISVRPALVTTPLTRGTTSFLHVNKNQCASGSLRSLGHVNWTSGHWWHQIQAIPMQTIASPILDAVLGVIQGLQGKKYEQIDRLKNKQ